MIFDDLVYFFRVDGLILKADLLGFVGKFIQAHRGRDILPPPDRKSVV